MFNPSYVPLAYHGSSRSIFVKDISGKNTFISTRSDRENKTMKLKAQIPSISTLTHTSFSNTAAAGGTS